MRKALAPSPRKPALREYVRFYFACFRRAFSGKYRLVEQSTGALLLIALLVDFWTRPSQQGERLIMTDAPAIFFMAALALTILLGIIAAPFEIYDAERLARRAAEDRLSPKLSLALPATGTVGIGLQGNTFETGHGTRQTLYRHWDFDVICLECRNIGEVPIHGTRARLMRAERQRGEKIEPLAIVEPIELPWKKEAPSSNLSADLAPNETKRIWLGGVRARGNFWVYRELKDLPLEYQQVFGEAGTFEIVIQVDSDDTPPLQAVLMVETAEGPRPENGVWRGLASVRLIDQRSPRIEAKP